MDIFRKNLKRLMEEKGLSQTKLAELLGLKSQSVNQWIKGPNIPRGRRLDELANLLGVTVNELLYEAKPSQPQQSEDMVLISKEELEAKNREIAYLRTIVELKKDNERLKNIEAVNEGQ